MKERGFHLNFNSTLKPQFQTYNGKHKEMRVKLFFSRFTIEHFSKIRKFTRYLANF